MQVLRVKNRGLYTNPNQLSSVPEGGLVKADNCVLDADNIIESRRGFSRLTATLPNSSDRANKFVFYQGFQIAHFGTNKVGYLDSTWTTYSGNYGHPDEDLARVRFLLSNSNLYFTSDSGIKKLDAYDATPVAAGMYKALDVQATTTGSSGFMSNNQQIAYRVVWGIRDANNNIIIGSPSGRAVVINSSGGSRDVALTITIPDGITTAHFYQIYRSAESGGVAVEPNDELGLVYESNPTSGEITAKSISVTDNTPNSLRGATLYTSQSQEGVAQANEPPPFAKDFAFFKDSVVYANTTSKHRLFLTILATGGSAGIAVDDTVTIAGTTYTAKGAEDASSDEFEVFTGGTPAQDIADTANSLVRVINQSTTNTDVYAYYLSGVNELPGKILIEERGLGGSSFAAVASARGTAYNPALPTSGTTVSSTNDNFINQLMISKSGLGEAVPLANTRRVGSANKAILRIIPLRDSLFIFKEEEGIYRMTGSDPSNFAIELFDSSARLLAPESAVVLNNQIWCLTDQGVSTVTETGVSVMSRPIEDLVLGAYGQDLDEVKYLSFGVAYETDRRYLLWTITQTGDTTPTQCFAFNTFTGAFTRWPLAKTCGLVNPGDDKLYLGDADANFINQERKDRTYTDYVDEAVGYTLSSFTGKNITLVSTNGIEVGDRLYQSSSVQSLITAIDNDTVTVQDTLQWTAGDVDVLKAIECDIEYATITADNPGVEKHFPEISFFFRQTRFNTLTARFASDYSGYFEEVPLQGTRIGLWGLFPWGSLPWGGTTRSRPIRTLIPLEKQRCSQLRIGLYHRQAYGAFPLLGFSLPVHMSESYQIAK